VRDGCQRTRRPEGRARRREPAVRGYKRAERVTRKFDPSALVGQASTMSAPPAFFLTFSAASRRVRLRREGLAGAGNRLAVRSDKSPSVAATRIRVDLERPHGRTSSEGRQVGSLIL
jgi:hypothetical protein